MRMGAHASVRPKTKTSSSLSFVVIVVAFSSGLCQGQENVSEGQTLLKFKSSLSNANHPRFSTWDLSTPPCFGNASNWLGVICTHGSVYGLHLENMNLRGQIDVLSLAPIRFLRKLSFMGNRFEGSMPDWKTVGALKSLFLSNNRFSGHIPTDAFKGMNSLKKVHLANNNFTGPLPTSLESPKLIELRLDNNRFTGTIPKISFENLALLSLANNQLEGPIPAPLTKFDPASFAGNKALCGKPLNTECASLLPAEEEEEEEEVEEKEPELPSRPPPNYALILAVVLLLVMLLAFRQNHQSQTYTPQLGRAGDEVANHRHVRTITAHPRRKSEGEQATGKLTFVTEDRHKFELQELMKASAEVLGSGNFGASYKAVLVDREALVVKRFRQMNHIAREDFHEHMRRLGKLKHPNLLPLVAYMYRKEEKLLVFNYVPNGSLATHLHGKHSAALNWGTRLKIIKGVAKGLLYLHDEVPTLTIPHGHLKSSNVLLDKEFNPVLMDYALAPVVNFNQLRQVLFAYKSPECAIHGHSISKKADVWCLGALILETLTGKYLEQGSGADIAAWIDGISKSAGEEVFDGEMEMGKESRREREKLLQIGMACCQEDAEKRWDLEAAVGQIELIHHDDKEHLLLSIASN